MTDTMASLAALLAALAGLITASVGLWVVYRKAVEAKKAAERGNEAIILVDGQIRELGKRVNGRLSALLEAEAGRRAAESKAARAEGVAAGEQAQRDRDMSPPEARP